jgi:hypothetical protein
MNGDDVQVAFARDPVEGGMLQGLLEQAGIPSYLREYRPDGRWLAIPLLLPGPQAVMVRGDQAEEAERLLAETLVAEGEDPDQTI